MSVKVQRDDALAAEYALGTLRGSARLRFQRRLQAEPALAAQVARWQTLLAGLDQVQPPVTPPETLWKKLPFPCRPTSASRPHAGRYRGLLPPALRWASRCRLTGCASR